MIILDLPIEQQTIIEQKSQQQQMTVEEYIISKILGDVSTTKEQPAEVHFTDLLTQMPNVGEDSDFCRKQDSIAPEIFV